MSGVNSKDIDRILAEQSAELLEAMKRNEPGSSEKLVAWLAESRRHVQHYLMMTALDRELQSIDANRQWPLDPTANARPENANVVALGARAPATAPSATSLRLPTSRRRFRTLAAMFVAGTALAAGITALTLHDRGWREFVTATGEQRAVGLDDGSVIHLNTRSRIQVRFSAQGRDLRLLAGEALFKVHREARRPFRVWTSDALIQAVGTEFNVYHRPEGTTVSVLEGRVRVIGAPEASAESGRLGKEPRDAAQSPRSASVGAGQRVNIDRAGQVVALKPDDQSTFGAWRQRRLIFKSTPLPQIAAEFNRYNRAPRLEPQGTEAEKRTFSGIFDADDPQSLIDLLEKEPGLAVERNGSVVIIR